MKYANKILLLIASIWLWGCASSYMVNSDYDREVNFRKYTSYKIVPLKDSGRVDPILNSSLNQKRINKAIDIEMQARGYEAKETGADVLISYVTDVKDKQSTQNYNSGWGYYGWWGPNNTQTRTYEQSRLIINMIDANTKQLVWQGWSTGELKNAAKDREASVREEVYRIMQKYPHRAGGGVNNTTSNKIR